MRVFRFPGLRFKPSMETRARASQTYPSLIEHCRPFATVAVPYGWVYAFYSRSMPGLVKIGMTTRSPEIRLAEANKGDTWRPPEKYRILCALRVRDAVEKEKEIHAAFARERIGAREFFRLPHAVVLQYFKRQARITRF